LCLGNLFLKEGRLYQSSIVINQVLIIPVIDNNLQLNLKMDPSPAQEEIGQGTESRIDLAKRSPSPRPLSSGNGFKRISPTGTTNVVFVPKKLLAKPRSGLALLAGQLSISNVPINGGILP
jgi:hypothetical protein